MDIDIKECEEKFAFQINSCSKNWEIDLPFLDLNFYCSYLLKQNEKNFKDWAKRYFKKSNPDNWFNILEVIRENNLTFDSLENISRKIGFIESNDEGFYVSKHNKNLYIETPSEKILFEYPYYRDIGLFHEIAHLFYEPLLRENLSWNYSPEKERFFEWKSRLWRSDALLLQKMLSLFSLPVNVYDRITLEVELKGPQLSFLEIPSSLVQEKEIWMESPHFYYPELHELIISSIKSP